MEHWDSLLQLAIQEDLGHGDVTCEAVVEPDLEGSAHVVGREPFVLSGSNVFRRIFELVDPSVAVECLFREGDRIEAGAPVFHLQGRVRSLLTAERTALNLLQRLCGVATLTRRMVDALAGTQCRLLDTRKTTPLWRGLEKEAVRHGGGTNHRFGLSDGILIKDNHIAAVGSVGEAVRRARRKACHLLKIEVEVENLEELAEALGAGADIVLLDNFPLDLLREAVVQNGGRAVLEASGGVTLDRVRAIGETGVDFVSCGALTHSARAIDLSLEYSSR
ncbi:carboxylating nicotinate-nucleotide diphosphorylase [Desulforhabdus sp. TSK]|uniref:carboxylating nicotinate-nucleotide diphosphorylase n=1 Tax=Desulforhabdus sp. TSK TaxID=2925014 RepID=UPI001FC80A34|nr:carboxylating nicotinate-nucleotide diphosphorylase [Desulforhabdus sp. TSK]